MRKASSLICSLLLSLALTACSTPSSDTGTTNATVETNQITQAKSSDQKDSGTVGSYAITIKSATIGKSFDGKQAVIITYDFTNNHPEATSFLSAISDIVYQNGIQLESTVISNDNDNWMKNIKTGATLEITRAYVLQDTTNPVDVEITELISFSNEKITKTFDLK